MCAKCFKLVRVKINDTITLIIFCDIDNDFRVGSTIASNMSWKFMNVFYDLSLSCLYGCTADTFSYRDAEEDQTRLVHYDRNTNKIYNGSVTGYVLPGPVYNGELFLANPGEKTLTVYATKDHRLEAPFEDIYAADKVEFIDQAVRLDNWVLVRKQGSSDLEVYDATSKKLLFRQRFDRVLGELHPDPLTKTICENAQDGLARLFRAVEQ